MSLILNIRTIFWILVKKNTNIIVEMGNLNMAGILASTSTLIIFFIAATMLIKMLEKNDRKQENL